MDESIYGERAHVRSSRRHEERHGSGIMGRCLRTPSMRTPMHLRMIPLHVDESGILMRSSMDRGSWGAGYVSLHQGSGRSLRPGPAGRWKVCTRIGLVRDASVLVRDASSH